MYLSANVIADDGLELSVVEVDDVVWENFASDIRAQMLVKGLAAQVVAPADVGRFAIERRCAELGDVLQWIDTLNPADD